LGRGSIASRAGAWCRWSAPRVHRPRRRSRKRGLRRNPRARSRASVIRAQVWENELRPCCGFLMADCRRRLLRQASRSLPLLVRFGECPRRPASAAGCLSSLAAPILRRADRSGPPQWRFGMCVPRCQAAVRHALSRRGFFNGALAASFVATAMAPERALAAPARSFASVVDLTHTMSPDFPTFFGVPGIEMDKKFEFKKDGFNLYWWRIIEHAGTHLDAPIHFSEAGATVEKIPANTLVVPLA